MSQPHWVDTHGHLFLIDDDVASVLDRAADKGVGWIMCPGVDVATSEVAAGYARRFPQSVQWAAGLHPHDAQDWPKVADRITELAQDADAIGECGLDWYRNLAPRNSQIEAFTAQIELARTLGKPIIVHCRDAFRDVFSILESADLGEKVVLHCWTGGSKWTKRFAELGVTFSYAGPLTYGGDDTLRLGARFAPPERTMVETDSPYLTPEPLRGRSNEPANVPLTGAVLADVWGIPVHEVAELTSATAARVFGDPRG